MRALHLIDGTRGVSGELDQAALACAALLRRARAREQRVCVIGPREAVRRLERLAVRVDEAVAPPFRNPLLAWRALAAIVRRVMPTVATCWGGDMLELSRLAMGPEVGRVGVLDEPGAGALCAASDWLGAAPGPTILVCHSEAAKAALSTAFPGLEIGVARPTVPTGASPGIDETIRSELGIAPGDLAVALIGSSPHAVAVRQVFLAAILGVSGSAVTAVVPSWAAQPARGRRYWRSLSVRPRLVVTDRPTHEVARACDLGVWDVGGTGPNTHRHSDGRRAVAPVAGAMVQGLPVVSPRVEALEGLYPESAARDLLAFSSALPEIARVVMRLSDDPGRRAALRREVFEHSASLGDRVTIARCGERGAVAAAVEDAWARLASPAAPPRVQAGVTAPTWGLTP